MEKITVLLPKELVRYADDRAAASHLNRSQIVGRALAELRQREQDALAREGYQFYAQEAEEFAAASGRAVAEALRHAG